MGRHVCKARHVYSAVVRPAMSYGSAVWHSLPEHNNLPKMATSKVSVIQNKCLGVVSGAYKATPIQVLEAETYVPPDVIVPQASTDQSALSATSKRTVKAHGQILQKDSRQIEKIKQAAPAESRPRQHNENMSGQRGAF